MLVHRVAIEPTPLRVSIRGKRWCAPLEKFVPLNLETLNPLCFTNLVRLRVRILLLLGLPADAAGHHTSSIRAASRWNPLGAERALL